MQFGFTKMTRMVVKLSLMPLILIVVLLCGAGIVPTNAQAQDAKKTAQQVAAGKKIFDDVNCLLCHVLKGKGGDGKGHPLNKSKEMDGVALRRDQANLRAWLKTHLFEEPRIDMFEEDPTDADIEALVQYLSTLKTPAANAQAPAAPAPAKKAGK
jgi:mono/diheme cytochrome c family protein